MIMSPSLMMLYLLLSHYYLINNYKLSTMAQLTKIMTMQFIQNALQNPLQNQKCSEMHGGTCNDKAISQFIMGCKGVYKMYLLVHLIPFLTFKRKRALKNPGKQTIKLLVGFVKSLLFAGGYSMVVRRIICLLTQHFSYNYIIAFISGLLGGVTLICQPIGRQSEIALYTLNKSTEILYNMAIRRNIPVRLPMGQCILNGLAISVLAFVFLTQPEMFRENYRKVIDQLLKDA